MLNTHDLQYRYTGGSAITYPDISCGDDHQPLLVLGASGSGKTTLLHLLGGLMQPTSGHVDLAGQNLSQLSGRQLDRFRGDHIGIVFQQNHFVSAISVVDNLLLAQKLGGKRQDRDHCLSLLERLQMSSYADRLPSALSQGQRQRVAIARALVNQPSLILADEPTSALDDTSCAEVITLLEDQAQASNAQLVIVTHDTRLKERYGQQVVLSPF